MKPSLFSGTGNIGLMGERIGGNMGGCMGKGQTDGHPSIHPSIHSASSKNKGTYISAFIPVYTSNTTSRDTLINGSVPFATNQRVNESLSS